MRARLLACTLATLTLAASTLLAPAARGALPAQMPDGTVPTLAPVMERVTPAVVNIATATTVAVRNPMTPFFAASSIRR